MAKNTVKYAVAADTKELIAGAQKGKKAIQDLGNSAKKSSREIKTIGGAVSAQKRKISELQYQYYKLSDAEKAAFGPQMNAQIQAQIGQLNKLKAAQAQLNAQVTGATSSFGKFGSAMSMAGSQMGLPIANLSMLMNPITATIAGVAALGAAFIATAKKTEQFNVALNDLGVRLNVPKEQLKQFGDDAIAMGNKFGVSGEEIVKQFQFMAQQAPGLEKDRDGLLALSEAANMLAVDFGVDVKDASNAVMTVLSKYNLEAKDAATISNVLAESCRGTGADLEYQRQVFEKVGSAANATGVSYQELASATGVLSSTFSDASVVGSGLQMMITKLQKAQDDYNPAVVGLTQAVKNMADANLSYSEITAMVGPRAAQVTQVLIDQQKAFDDLTQKMENTKAAEEMFGVKSEELGFVINKIKTLWSNFVTEIGNSAVFKTLMGIISDICKWIEQLSKEIQNMLKSDGQLNGFAKLWETLREAIKALLPVIGAVIKGFVWFYNKVYAYISDVIKFWVNMINKIINAAKKLWTSVKSIWNAVYKKIADDAVFKGVVNAYKWLKDKIVWLLKKAAEAWNTFVGAIGFDSLKISISSSNDDVGAPPSTGGSTKIAEPKTTEVTDTDLGGKGASGGSKGTGGKSSQNKTTSTTNNADFGTEEYYNKLIQERQELLKKTQLSREEEAKTIKEIVEYERKRDLIKKHQENQKRAYEIEAIAGEDTKKILKEKFGDRLPMYVDLFKDAKTDKDVKEIAENYGKLTGIVKLPTDIVVTGVKLQEDELRETYEKGMQSLSKLQSDYDIGIINEDKFLNKFNAIKSALEDMGLEVPVEPKLKPSGMKKVIDNAAGTLNQLGEAIQAIGNATQNEGLNAAAVIAAAIANVWLGFSDALAKDKTTKESIFAFLGAAIGGVATMIGVISQINANKYAEGGIISGNTTMGDKILARVNAGEMILNRRQQSNLFNALDHGRLNGETAISTSTIKIKGSDLYVTLRNYNKSKSSKDIGIR